MKLKIYSVSNCPDCKVVKSYLSAMGADYEEILVDDDLETADYIEQRTGQRRVPVVENGKGFVVGFNPDEIKKLIS